MRNREFQKGNGKMAGIHGTSALWPGSYNGHCPSQSGGMGSDPQMQFWDAQLWQEVTILILLPFVARLPYLPRTVPLAI